MKFLTQNKCFMPVWGGGKDKNGCSKNSKCTEGLLHAEGKTEKI